MNTVQKRKEKEHKEIAKHEEEWSGTFCASCSEGRGVRGGERGGEGEAARDLCLLNSWIYRQWGGQEGATHVEKTDKENRNKGTVKIKQEGKVKKGRGKGGGADVIKNVIKTQTKK